MTDGQQLNIIDKQGKIIGTASRDEIHDKGLLHREVHVWFYTQDGKIIFQHRGKDKDTYPNKLDSTVGGHVEIGEDYISAALKEVEEETGLVVKESNLKLIEIIQSNHHDPATNKTNNTHRAIYAFLFTGKLSDLKTEPGKGLGFEAFSIQQLNNLSDQEKTKFIPLLLSPTYLDLYERIQNKFI